MTKIIAFANQKGGVAKTTSAIALAQTLAMEGKRILFLDLDPQENASNTLRVNHKAYSFQIGTPTSKKLFLFESAIDLLSYYELSANKQNNYLSVSGVYQPNKKDTAYTIPAAVTKFLTQNPHIKTIHICFDNDNAGCKAANALYKQLSPKYEAFVEPPTQGKDYNDQLLYERGLPKTFKTRITKNHNKEDLTK